MSNAAIGPGIHACCYDVGPEVRQQFESQFAYAEDLFREIKESDPVREKYPLLFLTARAPGHSELPTKIFLDLVEANRRQLIDAGVSPKNISASPLCTACRSDAAIFVSRGKGSDGTNDSRGRNPDFGFTVRPKTGKLFRLSRAQRAQYARSLEMTVCGSVAD